MNPNNPTTPNSNASNPAPQVVHISRPLEPEKPAISDETRQRHEASKKQFPRLNLSDGEYVISAVKRSLIGLLQLWIVCGVVTAILAFFIVFLVSDPGGTVSNLGSDNGGILRLLALPLLLGAVFVVIGGVVGTYVYQENSFYLTNESVIQNVQSGLFNKRLQTVSLGNIEDASYTQNGIIPHIFNYGSIRLSTEGDETTYRFHFASEPEKQISLLNNAVEAFKNGRPVEG